MFGYSPPIRYTSYSATVRVQSIVINLSVCLSVCEHIFGTTGLIFTKLDVQIRCGRGSVLLWRRCDTLCTSGVINDVTFVGNRPYDDAWRLNMAQVGDSGSDVCESLTC